MKYILSIAATTLAVCAVLSVMPVHGETQIYTDVLRLHVIAESDSDEDQALKLLVRDAVLECVSEELADSKTYEEAAAKVELIKDKILTSAEECVRQNGANCSVSVELGQEKYPRRDYGEISLPAGVYNSLRVTLGEGEGKNWWCILFPGLCTPVAEKKTAGEEYVQVGFTPSEYSMITGESGRVKVRFKILELLSEVVGFEY